ncbi:hypothetical protein BDV29DRAFT_159699 [Aspergillus leporis]|uniref:DRBM domain-containing protein n=1 Tax=Aspergillus leporis TaxID=41062 RepID=A0A5N5WU22_9EURO|nr:hypothetical protein BDV29DRAFT_159699 [Aspergillus leporis]
MSPAAVPTDCYTSTDFEIGKRLSSTQMAIQLAVSSPEGRANDGLSQLDRLITTYDFEGAVAALAKANFDLPRTELIGDETYQDILYKIIGYVRLGDSKDSFPALMYRLPLLEIPSCQTDIAIDAIAQRLQTARGSSPSIPEADNWRYTSLLWEKAQVAGVKPEVTEACISNFPSKFRVTIKCLGAEASGEGRNKKLARHIAAKGVCEILKIRLT